MIDAIERYGAVVQKYRIDIWENEPEGYRFKAIITLVDNTTLLVKDYFLEKKRKYAFHWQASNNELIARWDNAPHWFDISTFPHHVHIKGNVYPSSLTSLQDVLDYITEKITIP